MAQLKRADTCGSIELSCCSIWHCFFGPVLTTLCLGSCHSLPDECEVKCDVLPVCEAREGRAALVHWCRGWEQVGERRCNERERLSKVLVMTCRCVVNGFL
ncbi:hypothetical protein E2C01_036316 [Portunus trituberculatus]|uniref:Uncharacterized protein n=1 Tax=Portunus trituberculatus TaxID=210409 RepID=A0A5B7FBR7_PORTR|nr:hypothetical protein [Portunus trituberculatus]